MKKILKELKGALKIKVYTKFGEKSLGQIVKEWEKREDEHLKRVEKYLREIT